MISLLTNTASLIGEQNLETDNTYQTNTIEQLTSGYRINSSGDDAAGLAVANQDLDQISQLTQGVQNGNDANAQLQIMDGGMSNISQILDRLQTLATESASGTFTGDRTTLNNEFQTDIQEIDRQAQSIGLNTGGTFAQDMNVFLGEGSGSQSVSNAVVNLNLSDATVDAQSLGLSGYQAIAGTSDLSSSSATSVSNILANTNNQTTSPDTTTLDFSGAGFSNLAVSVNLSGVSDINSLVTAINTAIQSTASGSSAQDAAFAQAGILASVNTDASGGEQLSFTSSTAAFQVQAGDQMANALMGNFSSGTTGAALSSTVTGQATGGTSSTQALATGQTINVQVSGAGLSSPETISLSQGTDATVGDALTDLMNQINNGTTAAGAAIKAAGISVSMNSDNQLVFSNTSNTPFQVTSAGDTGNGSTVAANLLGLGASQLNSSGDVTYSSITAGSTYASTGLTATAANSQTTLEFSVNGGQAINLAPIALDGGNATAATYTGGANLSGGVGIESGVNNQFSFNVDGHAVNVNLTASSSQGSAQATTTSGTVTPTDFATTNGEILVGLGGGALTAVTLTGSDTTVAQMASDLQAALVTAGFGTTDDPTITVGVNSSNQITLTDTSGATGTASQIDVQADPSDTQGTLAALGLTAGNYSGGVTATSTIAQEIQTQANAQLEGTGAGVTVSVNSNNQLEITNNNAGADHSITNVTSGTDQSTVADLFGSGLSAPTSTDGQNRTLTNLVTAINEEIGQNATLSAAGLQASSSTGTNSGSLMFTSSAGNTFQLNVGAASSVGSATGDLDITNGANFSQDPATLNLDVDGTTQTVTLNSNYSSAQALVTAINDQLTSSVAQASLLSVNGQNYLQITDSSGATGPNSSVQVESGTANSLLGLTAGTYTGADEANIGFGNASGESFAGEAGVAAASSTMNAINAGGTSQTGGISFSAIGANGGTQALTISANNSSGAMQSLTITLAATGSGTASLGNDGSASSLSAAVNYINQQLQKSDNPTLQSVVAVEQNVNGTPEIGFMSSSNFQVAIGTGGGANSQAAGGLNGGVAETATGSTTGSGGTISIATQAGAEAATTAIATAVSNLGAAQAIIGKGEDQLNYAVNLANSQITNVTVAESDIMDADVATEAANLSKAQVLNQAAIAALAQANSAPQNVLSLLRQ
jgi:flagellin